MNLILKSHEKAAVFSQVETYLASLNLRIISKDADRPWGGFFVLDEATAGAFAKQFFPGLELSSLQISGKLSPKILVVQPGKRLSWQYHHRRAEIWRVISGKVNVVTSQTNEETEHGELISGEALRLAQGHRHRLVGLNDWGIVAEIWQHTDVDHPSDEEDIVRLQDDFGR
jgi:mannose-6-phosphate isomerase-like protein (cupin superfamily)